MENYGRSVRTGLTVAAGIVLIAAVLRPQMPAVGPVWEYATATFSPTENRATICYAAPSGCKNDAADNMMIAAAKLGEKGWELTSATVTDVSGAPRIERVLYFKRLRSVLNRSDSASAH